MTTLKFCYYSFWIITGMLVAIIQINIIGIKVLTIPIILIILILSYLIFRYTNISKILLKTSFVNSLIKDEEKQIYHAANYKDGDKIWPDDLRFEFDNQTTMFDKGILVTCCNEARVNPEFENWLKRNITGYYFVWTFGNGRWNPNQIMYGPWKLWVDVSRPNDMLKLKMRFG